MVVLLVYPPACKASRKVANINNILGLIKVNSKTIEDDAVVFTMFIITDTIQVHSITDNSLPIWKCIFIARQADRRAI